MNQQQMTDRIATGEGFIAALDQSGGSTPKALRGYGIEEGAWNGDDEMFALIHAMRSRIVEAPCFGNGKVLGAILFEKTMDGESGGKPVPDRLKERGIVPFLKVDKGLEDEANGVQLMKPIPGLDALLSRAKSKGVFGTTMRSVILRGNREGIQAIVDQQFEIGRQILNAGLVPILEPEVDIHAPDKKHAETLLRDALLAGLDGLGGDDTVMLKLTLPDQDGFYQPLVDHPRVLKVVALSGGYSRDDANAKLARNPGVIASFSRALSEGLSASQSDSDFDSVLDEAVGSIYAASVA